jgi:hypothetical protein
MDIDSNLVSSSLKRSSDARDSLIDKRPKYDSEQAELNATLTKFSDWRMWTTLMQRAKDDRFVWEHFHTDALVGIAGVLAKTNQKDQFIDPLIHDQALEIVKRFSAEDNKVWEDSMRKGLEDGNWEDLIHHRACSYEQMKINSQPPNRHPSSRCTSLSHSAKCSHRAE